MGRIVKAASPQEVAAVRALFEEYARAVDVPACFEGFARELDALPGEYAPPGGALLLALESAQPAGCAALRRIDAATGEMKRLYVRPAFRASGAGRELAQAVVSVARDNGYARLVLDTLPGMGEAHALYRSLGFRPTGPYLSCPTPGASCYELIL
ncbi:MAG TPA: GNAT family N-acetyltransferase [Burkholderiales bacterium]|nr:GNAT family N-acetyltransferase [Burkholderiales bacterium]